MSHVHDCSVMSTWVSRVHICSTDFCVTCTWFSCEVDEDDTLTYERDVRASVYERVRTLRLHVRMFLFCTMCVRMVRVRKRLDWHIIFYRQERMDEEHTFLYLCILLLLYSVTKLFGFLCDLNFFCSGIPFLDI